MPLHIGGGVTDHTLLTNIGTHSHAQIDAALGYALLIVSSAGWTPVDSTTYYIGQSNNPIVNQGRIQVYTPLAGTIKKIYGIFSQTAGTNEASSISLLHNGVNETLISNALDHSAVTSIFSKTDLNQAVAAGDYVELKWVTPAWVTNPTTLRMNAILWIVT